MFEVCCLELPGSKLSNQRQGVYPFCQPLVSSADLSSNLVPDAIAIDNEHDAQTNSMSLYCSSSANERTADLGRDI